MRRRYWTTVGAASVRRFDDGSRGDREAQAAPRAAIYARYSSDRQSEQSTEDQVRLCRARAEHEGWTIVDVFPDVALSGATRDRPGLNAMMPRARAFDVILAETLDRISRDQEDVAAI